MGLDDDVETTGADVAAKVCQFVRGSYGGGSGERGLTMRGKERRRDDMTSAIQMVAERETPTRQWTRVAVPLSLPFSVGSQLVS